MIIFLCVSEASWRIQRQGVRILCRLDWRSARQFDIGVVDRFVEAIRGVGYFLCIMSLLLDCSVCVATGLQTADTCATPFSCGTVNPTACITHGAGSIPAAPNGSNALNANSCARSLIPDCWVGAGLEVEDDVEESRVTSYRPVETCRISTSSSIS